jgi:hemerythrin-like domain-containing protein
MLAVVTEVTAEHPAIRHHRNRDRGDMPITFGAKKESDFTDPIGMLGDCHRRIERFLGVLTSLSTQENGGALDPEQKAALATSLRYFREAAPKHTADEEESLFPRLRRSGAREVQSALSEVDALERDHARAAQWHREADRLGHRWLDEGQLGKEEASRFSAVVAELAQLYRRHISIEDKEVFPLAAGVLSASDRESIGAEMARRRGIHR